MRLPSPALLIATLLWASAAHADCRPDGELRATLQALKSTKWQLADDAERQRLALRLPDCLAAPDPVLRDQLAFEALSTWMRGKLLTTATVQTLRLQLLPKLAPAAIDPDDFSAPFAALTLAEVARIDRLQPFLADDERLGLLNSATSYLKNVRDYRGFDETAGWRHGVAHGADLLLQLSLNPKFERAQLDQILDAIASQLAPPGAHFYDYGEGERLMAPVFYIARRGLHQPADWEAWTSAATRLPAPDAAGMSQAWLARRHNLRGFLQPLYVSLQETPDAALRARLLPAVTKTLKALD